MALSTAGHAIDTGGEFFGAGRQVFPDVIQDLRPKVRRGFGPARRAARGLHRVAHVLAAGDGHLAQKLARFAIDRLGIAPIGSRLFPADIELGGTVHPFGASGAFVWLDLDQRFGFARGLGIGAQAFPSAFTAKAAFAYAAETGGGIEQVGCIHPNHACRQFWRDIQRKVYVFGPDRCGQPIAGVVGDLHCLGRGAEGGGYQNRTKDFFLHQPVGWVEPRDQRRRIKTPMRWHLGMHAEGFAVGIAVYHIRDGLQLHRINHSPHVYAFVQWIANAQGLHARAQFIVETIRDAFLDQQARSCTADLTLIEPDRIDQAFDG